MNEYATDAKDRESIPMQLAIVTIVAALLASLVVESLKDHFGVLKSYSWVIDVSSAPFFYDLFRKWFDKGLWRKTIVGRRLSEIPDLNGTWVGTGWSSYKDIDKGEVTEFRVIAYIEQTWSRISVELETKASVSTSTMATLNTEESLARGLSYEYINKPRYFDVHTHRMVAGTMTAHQGVAHLRIGDGGKTLTGEYYTDRSRRTFGALELTFHSPGRLSRDVLMALLEQPLDTDGVAAG